MNKKKIAKRKAEKARREAAWREAEELSKAREKEHEELIKRALEEGNKYKMKINELESRLGALGIEKDEYLRMRPDMHEVFEEEYFIEELENDIVNFIKEDFDKIIDIRNRSKDSIYSNTAIKYMIDTGRLNLNDYDVDLSIPVESNESLKPLEFLLREEIKDCISKSIYLLLIYDKSRYKFDSDLSYETKQAIDSSFDIVSKEEMNTGQMFRLTDHTRYPKYFPHWYRLRTLIN